MIMMNTRNQSLQICQVNISGLSGHSLVALDKYNCEIGNDILAIQETLLTSAPSNPITNMATFTMQNNRGVSLSIKYKLLPQHVKELEDNIVDAIWVTVKHETRIIMIGNIYVNPSGSSQNNLNAAIKNMENSLGYCKRLGIKDVIILGDFNSRNVSWGDNITNERGRTLDKFTKDKQLICMSPNSYTFVCKNGGSVIDMALISGNISSFHQSSSIDNEVELFTGAPTRGHLPVIHQFKLPKITQENPITLYKDLKNTNWVEWRKLLHYHINYYIIPHLTQYRDPSHLWKDFLSVLNHANNNKIPLKKVTKFSKPFWTETLSDLSRSVQNARSRFRARSTPLNAHNYEVAKELFANTLISEKNNWIHKQLENMNVTDSIRFWKKYKKTIAGITTEPMGNLYEEGVLYSETAQKDELLFKSFFSGSHMEHGRFDTAFEMDIEEKYHNIDLSDTTSPGTYNNQASNPDDLNYDILMEEICEAIKSQKSSAKSFDIDDLHPTIIKQFPRSAVKVMLVLFNLILKTGTWVWDVSNVTFLKKTGKSNYMKPGSYRPITISSYMGKILEKILENRIRTHCELNHILDDEQEGFRSKRNTSRYLYKLIARLDECRRRRITTFLLCIDFCKAFDSVWINGLIVKLHDYNINGNILALIDNFLKTRKVRLKVNDIFGSTRSCGSYGLPQGSILSPLLFIIYISDMLSKESLPPLCNTYSNILKYADDGSITVSHENRMVAHSVMQKMCDHLQQWCSKWRLIPNCDKNKTECIIINTKCSSQASRTPPKLKMGNKELEYVKSSTVLGLTIDDELNFEKHASAKLKQCWFTWFNITKNCNRMRGLNVSSLCILFQTVVLTKLFYAAPIWLGTNLTKFKNFYSRVILKISGSTHHPPHDIALIALSIPPIQVSYEILTTKFLLKAIRSDPTMQGLIHQLEEAKSHSFQHHIFLLQTYLSWKGHSITSTRNRLCLASIDTSEFLCIKLEARNFMTHLWIKHLHAGKNRREIVSFNKDCRKNLFPRHSSRKTDTQVMSLLHGHDLLFAKFRNTVTGECEPFCDICKDELDDNHHRLLICPYYNAEYRDNLINLIPPTEDPFTFIITTDSSTIIKDFRCMAQIIMEDP